MKLEDIKSKTKDAVDYLVQSLALRSRTYCSLAGKPVVYPMQKSKAEMTSEKAASQSAKRTRGPLLSRNSIWAAPIESNLFSLILKTNGKFVVRSRVLRSGRKRRHPD